MDVLEPRWYGVVYDDTFKTVIRGGPEVRRQVDTEGGRYLLGLGRRLITYPKGLVKMSWKNKDGRDNMPLNCWTSNGQNVFLDVSLQLQLKKDQLTDLYYMWGTHWRDNLRVVIQKEIKDVTPRFATLEYFTEREAITGNITEALGAKFKQMGNFFELRFFQLRQIGLPAAFEKAILQKILKLQEQKAALNTQQVELQRALARKEGAMASADANLVNTEAQETGNTAVAKQFADGQANLVEQYATEYKAYADKMGWLNDNNFGYDALHYFIYSRLGKDHRSTSTRELINFQDSAVLNV